MDPDVMFRVVTLSSVIAAILGGLSLGVYLAAVNQWHPFIQSRILSFSTLLTMGLSFLIPIFVARMVEGVATAQGWIGAMVLWVVFAASSSIGNGIATRGRKDR